MFKRHLPLVVVLIVANALPVAAQVGGGTDIWKFIANHDYHQPVVRVSLDNAAGTGVILYVDRDTPIGDGFKGYCLTAYHVVRDDNQRHAISIKYHNGRKSRNGRIVAFDEAFDVAIVSAWVPPGIAPVKLAVAPVSPRDYVEFSGLGGGSELACCLRNFGAQASRPTTADQIFADASLLPGDSGGPIFNEQRELTGIVSGGWFWWEGGVVGLHGDSIHATWPARGSNLRPIRRLVEQVPKLSHLIRQPEVAVTVAATP